MPEVGGIYYKIVIDPTTGIAQLKAFDIATGKSTAGLLAHQAAVTAGSARVASGLGAASAASLGLRNVFGSLTVTSAGLVTGIAGLVGILGLGAGLAGAIKLVTAGLREFNELMIESSNIAKEFEHEMSKVGAVSNATAKEMQLLTAENIRLGEETIFTTREVAQANFALAKSGLTVAEQIGALPPLLDYAAAGNLGMAEAAQIAADSMRQLNVQTKDLPKLMDMMTFGAIKSNQSLSDMGTAMRYVGTIATQLGISNEELIATLTVLARAGYRGAFAGTGLRQVLVTLNDEIRNGEREVGRLGRTLFDAEGHSIGLAESFRRLQAGGHAATEMTQLFETRAGVAATVLTNSADQIDIYAQALRDVEGLTKEIAEKNLDNLYGATIRAGSAFEALKIELGLMVNPVGRAVIDDMINPAVKGMREWLANNKALKLSVIDLGINLLIMVREIAKFVDGIRASVASLDIMEQIFFGLELLMGLVAAKLKEVRQELGFMLDALANVITVASIMMKVFRAPELQAEVNAAVLSLKAAAEVLRSESTEAGGEFTGMVNTAIERLKAFRKEMQEGMTTTELDEMKKKLAEAQAKLDALLNPPKAPTGVKSALDELGLKLDVDLKEKAELMMRGIQEAIRTGTPRLVLEISEMFEKMRAEAKLDLNIQEAVKEIEALDIAALQAYEKGQFQLVDALERRKEEIQKVLRGDTGPQVVELPIRVQPTDIDILPPSDDVVTKAKEDFNRTMQELFGVQYVEVETKRLVETVDGMWEEVTETTERALPLLLSFEEEYHAMILRMVGVTDVWATSIGIMFSAFQEVVGNLSQILGPMNSFAKGLQKIQAGILLVEGVIAIYRGAVLLASSLFPPFPPGIFAGSKMIVEGTAGVAKAKQLGASGDSGARPGGGGGGGGGGGSSFAENNREQIKTIAEGASAEFKRASKAAGLTPFDEPGTGDLPTYHDAAVRAASIAASQKPIGNVTVQAMDSKTFEQWIAEPKNANSVVKATMRTLED